MGDGLADVVGGDYKGNIYKEWRKERSWASFCVLRLVAIEGQVTCYPVRGGAFKPAMPHPRSTKQERSDNTNAAPSFPSLPTDAPTTHTSH